MLSGQEILREVMISQALPQFSRIQIIPFNEAQLNPNSYNLRLHNELMVYDCEVLDMKKENPVSIITIPDEGFVMMPNTLYLGRTVEKTITSDYVPVLDGRSSVARLGVQVHMTAGFGDAGFDGHWTFEFKVAQPVRIYAGVPIAQISYQDITGKYTPYNGKYNRNSDTQASKLYEDLTK